MGLSDLSYQSKAPLLCTQPGTEVALHVERVNDEWSVILYKSESQEMKLLFEKYKNTKIV